MGQPRNNYMPGLFRVEIDGFDSKNFTSAGPFKKNVGVATSRTGPDLLEVHEPNGKNTCEDLVLKRPLSADKDMENLYKRTLDARTGRGENIDELRITIDCVQMNHDHSDLERFRNYDCFVFDYEVDPFDVDADGPRMETVTIKRSDFERLSV